MNKEKENLLKTKSFLEKLLSRFAKKDPNLKGDWDTQFPNVGPEGGDEGIEEDVALKRQEYERALPVEHVLEEKLKDVDEALEKIDNGKSGICEKCGQKISKQRLEILPGTKTCKHCK